MNNHSTNLHGRVAGSIYLKDHGVSAESVKILSAMEGKQGTWVWNIQNKGKNPEMFLLVALTALQEQTPDVCALFLIPAKELEGKKTVALKNGAKTWLAGYLVQKNDDSLQLLVKSTANGGKPKGN